MDQKRKDMGKNNKANPITKQKTTPYNQHLYNTTTNKPKKTHQPKQPPKQQNTKLQQIKHSLNNPNEIPNHLRNISITKERDYQKHKISTEEKHSFS